MKVEETKNSTTGTMKTIKIAAGKMYFPTAYFFVFPGCFASGGRHSAAGPCADASGASNSQYCNLLLQIGLCVFLGGKMTIPQALQASFLYTREPFSTHISGFFLFQRENVCQIRRETSATGSRGNAPGGCRANGPAEMIGIFAFHPCASVLQWQQQSFPEGADF